MRKEAAMGKWSVRSQTIPKGGLQAKNHARAYARYGDTCTLSPLQVRLLLHQLRHHSNYFALILSVFLKPNTIVRRPPKYGKR